MECTECHKKITQNALNYSIKHYYYPLCAKHQSWLSMLKRTKKTTEETIQLYFYLKNSGINPTLEYWDGNKTIDIFIEEKQIAIEVDGNHHYNNSKVAVTDLARDLYSLKNGIATIRIPNIAITEEFFKSGNLIKTIMGNNRK